MNTDPDKQSEPETGSQPDELQSELQDENSITYPPSEMELEPQVSFFAGAITCVLAKKFTHGLGAQGARDLAAEVLDQFHNAECQTRRDEDYCPYLSLGIALNIALSERYPQYFGSVKVREWKHLIAAFIDWLEGAAPRYTSSTFGGGSILDATTVL
jgi:hypothetical protein